MGPNTTKQIKEEFISWYYDTKDKFTWENCFIAIITLIIFLLAAPLYFMYLLIIKLVYKAGLTVYDMRKVGLKNAYRKNFLEDTDHTKYEEELQKEKEFEDRLTLENEEAKSFSAKKLWPDAVIKNGNAIYSSDGRTLLHVHENVEEFTIPEGTVNVYHKCFTHCTKLSKVTFPSTIKRIGNQAFSNCISLSDLSIPDSVESIGSGVFKNCVSLESISLPSSMVEIPVEMFYDCKSIREISLPEETTLICQKAFSRCTSLEHVSTNDKLEIIREKAFEDCWSLKEFFMPDRVRSIEIGTFNNCHSMEKLHLSKNIRSFGGSCCENCWNLQEVTMDPNEAFIQRAHDNWEKYGEEVMAIESDYPIPECLYWTYNNALYTNIPRLSNVCLVLCLAKEEEFTIPDFVVEVKQYAFTTCKNLKRLHLSPKLHPIAKDWKETSFINHEFIFECWPQIEEVSFDKDLNPKPYPITFV